MKWCQIRAHGEKAKLERMNETTDEKIEQLEHEVKELIGVCLGLMSHVRAIRAVLDENTRKNIEAELMKNHEGKFISSQGKMLDEATVEDLSKLLNMLRQN
jgi:predicted  nucleic acid-binding Zn-ribbon protein